MLTVTVPLWKLLLGKFIPRVKIIVPCLRIHNKEDYYMKYSIFVLLSFISFVFPLRSHARLQELSKAEQAVWRVHGLDSKGEEYVIGTGFFIGETHFITNFHVALSMPLDNLENGAIILSQEGHDWTLKVTDLLAASAFYDLALYETDNLVTNYLSLRKAPLGKRENLVIPAYPRGVFTRIKKSGDILDNYSFPTHLMVNPYYSFPIHPIEVLDETLETEINKDLLDESYYHVTHKLLQGASGAPVLDDQGQIAGVLWAASKYEPNIVQAIKVDHLRQFLAGNIGTRCTIPIDEDVTYYPKSPGSIRHQFCIRKELDNLIELHGKGVLHATEMLKGSLITMLRRIFSMTTDAEPSEPHLIQ